MEENKNITLKRAVSLVNWTYNTNMMVSGNISVQLMTGMIVIFPGTSQGNEAMESMYEDEGVRRIMEGHYETRKKYKEQEFGSELDKPGV